MKRLIYFTLGNNTSYIKLAKICIDSIYTNGYNEDILFITNLQDDVINEIEFRSPVYFLKVEESNLMHSSANKLRIFEWVNSKDYSDIIFCDLDMLCVGSMDAIFQAIEPNKICFSSDRPQHLMSGPWHAGKGLLNPDETAEIENNQLIGVNAGLFGFKSDLLPQIKLIYDYFLDNLNKMGRCLEQPAINVYCYRHNLLSRSLTKLVCQDGMHLKPSDININDYSLIHFQGGPGNQKRKYKKIKTFLA